MKVLLINSVYREGSTGKIVASIADTLREQGHEVQTCYGIGNSHIDEYSEKICGNLEHSINAVLSRITGIPYGGVFLSNIRIKRIIKQFKPDVVHVHCINASIINVYSLFEYLAKTGIKTVLSLHAEIFHTAGCEHAYECEEWKTGCHKCLNYKQKVSSWFFEGSAASYKKMFKAINSFSTEKLIITAVSPWLADRAKLSPIMKNYKVIYVPNGVETSIFHYKKDSNLLSREKYKYTILFVTPYFGIEESDVKGGRFLPRIAEELSNCKFIVVASRISNSLPDLPDNVRPWGRAKTQQELAQLYSEADLTILLSRRETFSMVTAESLCCGTAVVGFKAGGPESIAIKEASHFVNYKDLGGLKKRIVAVLEYGYDKQSLSEKATKIYSKEYMVDSFIKVYRI